MSASGATVTYGSLLQLSDNGGTPVYTSIAEVVSISGPSFKRTMIDVTHQNSDNNAKEYIGGLVDGDMVKFTLNFIPTNSTQADLITSIQDPTDAGTRLITDVVRKWRIKFGGTPTSTFVFEAAVQSIEPHMPMDDKISADVTFKVSGLPVLS